MCEAVDHILACMVRPTFKPSLSFTVAAYACSDLTGQKLQLYPVVIEALELDELLVVSVTSDGAGQNCVVLQAVQDLPKRS